MNKSTTMSKTTSRQGRGFPLVALAALIALVAGNAASAATLGLDGSSCAWADASWTNSAGVAASPSADDTVVIYDQTVTVSDDDMSAVSALALITGSQDGAICFNVSNPASISSKVSVVKLVKKGGGELSLLDLTQTGYNVNISVEKGVLRMPVAGTTTTFNYGELVVGEEGTIVLPVPTTGNLTVHCSRIDCAGVITNAASGYLSLYQNSATVQKPGVITGLIGGSFRFFQTTPLIFSNANSTCTTILRPSSSQFANPVPNYVGLVKIGKTTDTKSSIGSISVIGAQGNGVLYKYLGEEAEETDKKYYFSQIGTPHRVYLNGWDAGPYGGITFKGQWAQGVWNNASLTVGATTQQPLLLTGENTEHPCVLDNDLDIGPAYILKRGSGIWRFNATKGKKNDGVIGVEEGTLQFESIDDAGRVCSLGLSTNLYGNYSGDFDDTKKVPYAFALGSADHEGVMEFVGETTNAAVSTTRSFALLGDGRIVNSGNRRIALGGFGPGSDGAKTLTLDGSRADCGVIYDVTGNVSVVKTGSGGWTLGGNQRFTGSLRVEEGVLTVSNPSKYSWFRFKILENKLYHDYVAGTATSADAKYAYQQQFEEFALYDVDGVRQNLEMTSTSHLAAAFYYESGYCAELPAGQMAFGREGSWYYYTNYLYSIKTLCNNKIDYVGSSYRPFVSWCNDSSALATCLALSRPEKSFPIVMHLPDSAGEIRSYDFVSSSVRGSPYSFSLEGSKDGLAWDMLHCVTNYTGYPENANCWYYDGEPFEPSQTRTGFAIDTAPTCTLLDNVSSVYVAAGATLRAEGDIAPLRGITVDAVAGMGTIDGFEFSSEGGTLTVANMDATAASVTLPGTYSSDGGTLSNVADWNLVVNGRPSTGFSITADGGALKLTRRGLLMLIR